MTPSEIRNLTFERLQASLVDRRRDVFRAFMDHGPGTTAQIAQRSGIGLLTLRPRACELVELGLLTCQGRQPENGVSAGVYAAVTSEYEWNAWRAASFPVDGQLQMGLNAAGALTT